MSSSDSSSTFSSLGGSAAAAAPVDAVGSGPVVGPSPPPPPPDPTFDNSSFTFLPSRALARRFAQMVAMSRLAAFVRVMILSD